MQHIAAFSDRPKDVWGSPAVPEEFSFTAFLALFLFLRFSLCVCVCSCVCVRARVRVLQEGAQPGLCLHAPHVHFIAYGLTRT